MVKTKWKDDESRFGMTSHPTGSESRNDAAEKCGNHSSSTTTSCGRTTGWGTDYQHGPCRDHAEDGYQYSDDDSENADSTTNDESLVVDREFYEENAEFLLTLMGQEDAWENHSVEDTVAKKAIKAHNGGPAEYLAVFGECSVEGCDSGCNGFETDYCYDHPKDGQEGSDDEDTTSDGQNKFCPECGGEIDYSDASFCPLCGQEL